MGFSLANFIGDPFALTTVSFGIISWIVAIAGAGASDHSKFPTFTWWGLVYELVIIIIVFILYCNNNIELYKFMLVGLTSVAFIYTTMSINYLIYASASGELACAAGCILLSILFMIWIMYFGGHPESPTNQFIDSFSLRNQTPSHEKLIGTTAMTGGDPTTGFGKDNHDESDNEYRRYISPVNLPDHHLNQQQPLPQQQRLATSGSIAAASAIPQTSISKQYMSSSQLNGLEKSSDIQQRDLTKNNRDTIYTESENGTGITFRYKAKALYSYDANPDDINEISFTKDEILEVDDIDGKWWQARRANGQLGICPSNYVKLLNE